MGMYKLQSIGKYERPEGIEFAVRSPTKIARQHAALSAIFGPEVQIDGKKYKVSGFAVHSGSAPVKQGETIGILVKPQ